MGKFLARRALFAVITVLAATLIVFTVSRLVGDPLDFMIRPEGYGVSPEQKAAISKKIGLDRPLAMQYLIWVGGWFQGDFGKTLLTERPVVDVISEKVPATIQLAVVSWILATLIGGTGGGILRREPGRILRLSWPGLCLVRPGCTGVLAGNHGYPDFRSHIGLVPLGHHGPGGLQFLGTGQALRPSCDSLGMERCRKLRTTHQVCDARGS